MMRKDSLDEEDTQDVKPIDNDKSWDMNRKLKRGSSRKYKSATVRFMGKRGNVVFFSRALNDDSNHNDSNRKRSGCDFCKHDESNSNIKYIGRYCCGGYIII